MHCKVCNKPWRWLLNAKGPLWVLSQDVTIWSVGLFWGAWSLKLPYTSTPAARQPTAQKSYTAAFDFPFIKLYQKSRQNPG